MLLLWLPRVPRGASQAPSGHAPRPSPHGRRVAVLPVFDIGRLDDDARL